MLISEKLQIAIAPVCNVYTDLEGTWPDITQHSFLPVKCRDGVNYIGK